MRSDIEIIDDLGGTAAAARLFDVSMAAICQWRKRGIPKARRMYIELKWPELTSARAKQGEAYLPVPTESPIRKGKK